MVILKQEKDGLKKDMFDMLSTKMTLLFLVDLKEVELIPIFQHLIHVSFVIDVVMSQVLYCFFHVVDVEDFSVRVLVD